MNKIEKRHVSQGVYTIKNIPKETVTPENLTFEKIKNIAKTCGTKTEFHKKHYKLYQYVMQMGWKDKLTKILPHKRKWTFETLMQEAQKYKTRGEFMRANISAYNVALKSKKYKEIIAHMGEKKRFEPETKWTFEKVKEIYAKCKSLKQLREKYGQKVIASTIRSGWHDELSKHFIKEPRPNLKWTFEKVRDEAKKYKSRKEFGLKSPSAYQKALEMKWMDAISGHMKLGYTKWTKEKMLDIIKECHDMADVKKKSGALYVYIMRHKLQKELFKN
jgi:hypothetical protein